MNRLMLLALFISIPAAAGAGPAFDQLRSAAGARPAASLETQAQDAGASFHGGQASSRPNLTADTSPDSRPAALPKAEPKAADSSKDEPPAPGELSPGEKRELKLIRAGGIAVAAGGAGLMAYAVLAAAAGPVGWAAAAMFFGGMAAYLAHRRLNGHSALA